MTTARGTAPTMRERILEAAMDVFAEQGFRGATISEVERRVGLAAGTGSLYRHFPSKEALMQAAVAREVERARAEMAEARASAGAQADPAMRYRQMLQDMRRFDRLFRLMINEGERVPELRAAIWTAVQRPVKGTLREADVVEAIAMAALGGYHLFSMMQGRPFNGVRQDLFLRVLADLTQPGQETDREAE